LTKGERHYQFKHGSLVAKPGYLMILPPRLVHKARCSPNEKTGFRIATLAEISSATVEGSVTIARSEPQLLEAFLSIFRMLTGTNDTKATALIQTHLGDILAACVSANVEGHNMLPPQVRDLQTYMRSHLNEMPSLDHLSSLVGWNQYYLSHVFSKYVGLSPVAFHTRARLMHARSLISQEWTLSDTSAHLVFSDQSHFGRHFRRVYDMTPGEYRQSVAAV
jgi:AraC-like DNA-binding protein